MSKLPTDAQVRKNLPIGTGVLDYFPRALAAIAAVSLAGNKQHFPEGTPLHWDKTKSTDHWNCIVRHGMERGTIDKDGQPHSVKLAWRALALLEIELEAEEEAKKEKEVCEYCGCSPLHELDCPIVLGSASQGPPIIESWSRKTLTDEAVEDLRHRAI